MLPPTQTSSSFVALSFFPGAVLCYTYNRQCCRRQQYHSLSRIRNNERPALVPVSSVSQIRNTEQLVIVDSDLSCILSDPFTIASGRHSSYENYYTCRIAIIWNLLLILNRPTHSSPTFVFTHLLVRRSCKIRSTDSGRFIMAYS